MERFLQTLAAATYAVNVMMYGLAFFFIVYVTFFTKFWLLLPVSIFWTWYDRETTRKGGRPLRVVRGFPVLRYFREYFPMRLVKTANLEPKRNYIFGSHPHGVLCASTFGNFLISYSERETLFPGLNFFTPALDFNFRYPLVRDLALAWENMIATRVRPSFITSCLQNISAFLYCSHLFMHVFTAVFLIFLLFYTEYWPLVLLSVCWTSYDKDTPSRGGRQSWLVKHIPMWKYLRDYFPATLVKTADLDPGKNYIFCTHPHGIMGIGNNAQFIGGYSSAPQLFPGLKFHTATMSANFLLPILRDYILALGFVSVSCDSLKYLLNDKQRGNVVNLLVGGVSESRYAQSGQYRIVLKRRKGFVKVALSTGCCLVPVFCFRENDCWELVYPQASNYLLSSLQKWFQRVTRVSFRFIRGRFRFFRLMPRKVPLFTVVGKPIEVPKVSSPTQEEVDHYHSLYTEELMKLFNENKHLYVPDPENTHLVIAE